MRLSTGLSEEDEEDEEVEAAGLGGISVPSSCGWCCCCWVDGVGRYGDRRLWVSLNRVLVPGLLPDWCCWLWVGTVVFDEGFRELPGRTGTAVLAGGPETIAVLYSSSFLGFGVPTSLRPESTDESRPAPEPMRLAESAAI